MYILSQDNKEWLDELISSMPEGQRKTNAQNWLKNSSAPLTEPQLDSFQALFIDNDLHPHVDSFIKWVKKGGTRPPRPH